jgi:pimeloyl-ACP methyl ester carboxylesterase
LLRWLRTGMFKLTQNGVTEMTTSQDEMIGAASLRTARPEKGVPVQRKVEFSSDGVRLVGTLYVSEDARPDLRRPGIVVTGSWTTVKEQMAGLYARRLAAEGFIALAFDFRGFGESEGDLRDYECPAMKAQDIRSAFNFMETLPQIDPNRMGALAICASAGYAATAAAEDARIRSLALVAPWIHDAELVRLVYGGEQGVAERIAKGRAAYAKYERSKVVDSVPVVSTVDPDAAMYGQFDYYLDPKRGAVPQWGNRFAVMSWPDWLEFDPIRIASRVQVPTLSVHSEEAAIPIGIKRFCAAMRAPNELRWTSGTQYDFYDQEPNVTFAVQAAVDHFHKSL